MKNYFKQMKGRHTMKVVIGSIKSLQEYIHRQFRETSVFEFTLSFSDEYSNRFEEINRFQQQSVEQFARFRNRYTGRTVIDLSEWSDKPINSKLFAFLYFLKDRELYDKKNKTTFVCETHLEPELIERIEDIFDEQVDVIDLGVKQKTKNPIGFHVFNEKDGVDDVRV